MAGMIDMFGGTASCTLFAPTNDAFEQIPENELNSLLGDEEKLISTLSRHVLPKKKPSGSFLVGDNKEKTLEGDYIVVSRHWRQMNVNSSEGAAFVTEQNVRGTNGIIHVIDNVLFKSQQDNNNGGKDPQNGSQKTGKDGNDIHQRPGTKTTTKNPSTGQNQPNSWNNGHKTAGKNGKNDNNANQLPQYNSGQKSGQNGHLRRQKSHSGGSQSSRNGRRQPRNQRVRQQSRPRPQQQSQRRRYQRRYRY